MTAKEQVLERASGWSEAQATAALRVVEAHGELVGYFDDEAGLSPEELESREEGMAKANAREAIREEPW